MESEYTVSRKSGGAMAEVYDLLINEGLTVGQIAQRRQTSKRSVYFVIQRLKRGGVPFTKGGVHTPPTVHKGNTYVSDGEVRLHNQQFSIKILWASDAFIKRDPVNLRVSYEEATVILNRRSLDIYSNLSFYGVDASGAMGSSTPIWEAFMQRLERNHGILILKDRYENVRMVRAHFSLVRNGLAKDLEARGEKLKVYAREDGKLAFLVDNSLDLHEFEAVHPATAKGDAERLQPFFNDIRDNKLPLVSEIWNVLGSTVKLQQETLKVQHETACGVALLVKMVTPKDDVVEQNVGTALPEYIG